MRMTDEPRGIPASGRALAVRRALGALAIAVGALVMLAWLLHLGLLVSPRGVSMQANAALAVLLGGVSIISLARRPRAVRLGAVSAALVLLVGSSALLEYVTSTSWGIDEAVVRDFRSSALPYPGRMSFATAGALTLLGCSLLTLALGRRTRWIRAAHVMATATAAVALLAVAATAYGVAATYGAAPFVTVTLPTGIALLLLAIAALLTRTAEGWEEPFLGRPIARRAFTRIGAMSILIPLATGMLAVLGSRYGLYQAAAAPAFFAVATACALLWLAFRSSRILAAAEEDVQSARRETRSSQQWLGLALSSTRGIGIWDWDIINNRVVADEYFSRLYGVDPGLARAGAPIEHFFSCIDPADLPRLRASIDRTLQTGAPFTEEYRLMRGGERPLWVLAEGRCERTATGQPQRLSGVSIDITDRKTAESHQGALLELSDRVRDLVDPEAITFEACRILGETLQVSRVGYGLVSKTNETISIDRDWNAPGIKTIAGVLHFRDYGSYIENLKRGETVVVADARVDARTAGSAAALEAISALGFVNMPLVEQGDLVALLYANHAYAREWPEADLRLMRDTADRVRAASERARAAAELAALNANLEAEVAKRTHALMLSEEQLRQSQKMEAVGQLTGGIAHDFNNLLTGISGSLELLQARAAQGRLHDIERYIVAAQGASKRAAALTHRLLAFARRQTLDPKPTNANRLIAGMEDLIRRTVGPGIRLEVVEAGGLWPTLVDPHQLENALLNLCINSRDAMPTGGRITIETSNKWLDEQAATARDLPPGQYIAVCVSDTGTGMAPEITARAFEPFFTTKPLGEGTGLGLSMIYGFVRQSGGQVRIYSELGQGAMVCLYLPRHRGEAELAEPEAPARELIDREITGETVLVVDDEPTVRMLITDVLEEMGYAAIEAADATAGLKILESNVRIDLLVSDVGLPGGINGRQMVDAARLVRPGLKVLFITGYAENAAVGNGHLEHDMHVMTKPFAMDAMARRIRELIAPDRPTAR